MPFRAADDDSSDSDRSSDNDDSQSESSSSSSGSDNSIDEKCDDVDLASEEEHPLCLLCETKFPLDHVFVHLNEEHKLDLFYLRKKFRMDQESYIKLVNFVRTEVKMADNCPKNTLVEALMKCTDPVWNDEVYLQPIINDDPMLTFWFEYDAEGEIPTVDMSPTVVGSGDSASSLVALSAENYELKQKNLEYENALSEAYDKMQKMQEVMNRICLDSKAVKNRSIHHILRKDTAATETDYFASYDDVGIHDQMLTDAPRTKAYEQAVPQNETDFKNKIVLDVGCGTGILSMFAAKSGASKVIAVDRSNILDKAVQIVKENGFENIIECLRGTVEAIKLPVDKVDIIISEWMGYFLLYEGMLSSVIQARNRYLKVGGSMYPNTSDLFIQGISDIGKYEEKRTKWDNVYGFKMTCLNSERQYECPAVDSVNETVCVTEPVNVLSLDLMTCENEDTVFEKKFIFKVTRECQITALIGYFDVGFTMGSTFSNVLSTSPMNPTTHWAQSVFYLPKLISVKQGDDLHGVFACRPNSENPRWLTFTVTLAGDTYTYQMK